MGAATDFAGLDVTELDVETIVADDVLGTLVMEWGYCNYAANSADQPIALRRVLVLSRKGDRMRIRLDDGREQDVHERSIAMDTPIDQRVTEGDMQRAREEIPGIADMQAYYRAKGLKTLQRMQRQATARRFG